MRAQADAAISQARLVIGERLLRLDAIVRPGRFTLDDSSRISELVGLGKFTAKDRFEVVAERFFGNVAAHSSPATPCPPRCKFQRSLRTISSWGTKSRSQNNFTDSVGWCSSNEAASDMGIGADALVAPWLAPCRWDSGGDRDRPRQLGRFAWASCG